MARPNPQNRSASTRKTNSRITRRYRPAEKLNIRRKIRLGESEHVLNMCVILCIAGFNNTQIGKVVNISRGQVKELLESPEGQELYQGLLVAIPEAAKTLLESLAIEAVQSIADVMRSSSDEKYILQAAGEILDRTGLPKATKSEKKVHNTNEELTRITDDGLVDRLREAPPDVQEKAASMIEDLEQMLSEFGQEEEVADESSD